jgi:phosphoglucomutase
MEYRERYEAWLNSPFADDKTKAELAAVGGDDKEIYDRFWRDMAFGTAGMRGLIGAGTNRINRYTVRRATLGFARYLKQTAENAAERGVVIAHDNRRMSRVFCMETAGVLAAEGIRAYIFDDLRPTPELSFAVRELGAAGGVVITASHNPPEYNGYKVYDSEGCQLLPAMTDRLGAIIEAIDDPLSIRSLTETEAGDLIRLVPDDLDERYYNAVMAIRLRSVKAGDLSVVYSPQHGTGNVPVRTVLARCGYRVIPVKDQCFPDEDFVNTESPNPEMPAAFAHALKLAAECDADIAISTDPDCDRLGVAVRRGPGDYVLMTGNQSGAVLIDYILSTRKEQGTLPQGGVMCTTVVTSALGNRVCEHYGVRVDLTLTGFKFIGEKMHRYKTEKNGTFLFGYEESYGCLIADICRDKDGVQASLMLCEAAAYYKAQGKTLLDVLEGLYARHGYCLDTQTNVYHKGAEGVAKIAALLDNLRKNPPRRVGDATVTTVEDYLTPAMTAKGFPPSNVLRYLFSDGSFVAVRPSGTEPKCKYYYCVMAKDRAEAERKLAALKAAFEV